MRGLHVSSVEPLSIIVRDGFCADDEKGGIEKMDAISRDSAEIPTPDDATNAGMSWSECFFQILISIQGPTAFLLPVCFKSIGYIFCIAGSFFLLSLYVYTSRTYLWCEKEIRRRERIPEDKRMNIYSIISLTFTGSPNKKRVAFFLNKYLKYEIILSWSLTLSFGELFLCGNIRIILLYLGYEMSNRQILWCLLPVTTAVAWVPNLKVMASVSFVSTFILVSVMLQIVCIILLDPTPLPPITMMGDPSGLFSFLAILFSSMTCTPLLFPLKNEMKRSESLSSCFGSWNVSLCFFVVLNVFFSFFCYVKFGDDTEENILNNLPLKLPLIVSNGLIAMTVVTGAGVTFFVVFDTIWSENFKAVRANGKCEIFYEYAARTLLNLLITVVAVAVPSLDLFINLISCFSYPFDSVLLPMILYTVLAWENPYGSFPFFVLLHLALSAVCVLFSWTTFVAFLNGIVSFYS